MRAIIIFVVLGLLFLLVRNSGDLDFGLDRINPVILGYGALFVAGIVTAELLRPVLVLLGSTSRFVVVALLAALVWIGFEGAQNAGKIPDAWLNSTAISPVNDVAQTSLPLAWDGVHRAVAQVNNMSLAVAIDTGTPLVVLQYSEAERLGLNPKRLKFEQRITVGDRKILVAKVRLGSVRIDDIELAKVDAAIAAPDALETNIIGLSFLTRLSNVSLIEGQLFLRQ